MAADEGLNLGRRQGSSEQDIEGRMHTDHFVQHEAVEHHQPVGGAAGQHHIQKGRRLQRLGDDA